MRIVFAATVVLIGIVGAFGLGGVLLGGWDFPPVASDQFGYRGTAMANVTNPRDVADLVARNQVPEAEPLAEPGGEPVSEIYENVQVLGDLNEEAFLRFMTAITEWVSPEEGCLYCHNPENLADDNIYTKIVSRRMIEMTRHINGAWADHVGETGVTCLTCHRGQPVPANIWFENPGPRQVKGMAGYRGGQNTATGGVGLTSLHYDPFTPLMGQDAEINIEGATALPEGHDISLQETEQTYSLMVHFSQSLGANCTFCHNSRAFSAWNEGTPKRITAWHGLRMVRDLNGAYLEPLTGTFPTERLGPLGDVAKVNCATCHQGLNKPFNGVSMLADYPSLAPSVEPPGDAATATE